ncbi:hypothetical protein [Nocardioides convexus]|uniref:hypothetical protein n=1 Tax=Nocardioides convexus TaxID=2712224 RepID=UPI0024187A0E|nr:hypothetical protein [Nocardioides convexus]
MLGDARSNYSDLHEETLRHLAGSVRRSFWLNPEHQRNWGTGDSAAPTYADIVPMIECRNMAQAQRLRPRPGLVTRCGSARRRGSAASACAPCGTTRTRG